MQILINLRDYDYENIKSDSYSYVAGYIAWVAIQNGVVLTERQESTNGDVIKAVFPYIDIADCDSGTGEGLVISYGSMENIFGKGMPIVDRNWWNAPYKAERETKE